MSRPLADYRVLEVGARIASAYATKSLLELGARVTALRPDPDPIAASPPLAGSPRVSTLAMYLDAGKDMRPFDRDALWRLAAASDIVVVGLSPQEAGALDLVPGPFEQRAPNAVLVNVTSFGLDGPYRDFLGDDTLLLAIGGIMDVTGDPDREPLATYGHFAEYHLGMAAAVAALHALYGAATGDTAASADVAGFEVTASQLEGQLAMYLAGGFKRTRSGNRYFTPGSILDIFDCADGTFCVAIFLEHQWEGLVIAIGQAEWLVDPAWLGWPNRARRMDEIYAAIRDWAAPLTREQVREALQEGHVPNASNFDVREVVADPQHAARGFFGEPDARGVREVGYPARIDGERPFATSPVPPAPPRAPVAPRTIPAGPRIAPPGPLEGVRVVDLTQVWAGPFSTAILADAGAQVIRVESPDKPDLFRLSETMPGETAMYERGPFFHSANRNKLSISLNLFSAEGRKVLADLVRHADAVVDNFSARVMGTFGLDAAGVHAINPRAVTISMPAFGHGGPYGDHVCYGEAMEGMGGMSPMTGYPGGPPRRTGMAIIDAAVAFHGAMSVVAGLVAARNTGRGPAIDLSHFETCARDIGEELLAAQLGAPQPQRHGNRNPLYAPQGVYRCAGEDAWVMVSVRDDAQWRALVHTLGGPSLDPAWDLAARAARHDTIDAAIGRWTAPLDKHDAMLRLQAAGVPALAVLHGWEVATDEHLEARGFLARTTHALAGAEILPGALFRLHPNPPRVAASASLFGEHTDAILRDIAGYDDERIAALRASGVVGRLPEIETAALE